MPDGTRTVLARATSNSESVRTTVPHWIIEQFGVKIGDSVYWKIDFNGEKPRIFVEFEKSKKESNVS